MKTELKELRVKSHVLQTELRNWIQKEAVGPGVFDGLTVVSRR